MGRQQRYSQLYRLVLSLLVFCLVAGCVHDRRTDCDLSTQQALLAFGTTWRDRWWDHYQQGITYAKARRWKAARCAFEKAIKRSYSWQEDRYDVRTYGMHFTDYFPHREMGVATFHLAEYENAKHHLDISLSPGKDHTAKAKFYLNQVNKKLLELGQPKHDTAHPQIETSLGNKPLSCSSLSKRQELRPVTQKDARRTPPSACFPYRNDVTRCWTIMLSGQATDDTFVADIVINNQRHFVELASSCISFQQEIELQPGDNTIQIQAVDLLGNATDLPKPIIVHLDREGPLVSLEKPFIFRGKMAQQQVIVRVLDDSGIVHFKLYKDQTKKELLLHDKLQPQQGKWPLEWIREFNREFPLFGDNTPLPFEAEDAAGNVTSGHINLGHMTNVRQGYRSPTLLQLLPRWVLFRPRNIISDAGEIPSPLRLAQETGSKPPSIVVKNVRGEEISCIDDMELEIYGNVISLKGHVEAGSNFLHKFLIDDKLSSEVRPSSVEHSFDEEFRYEYSKEKTIHFELRAIDETKNDTTCQVNVKLIPHKKKTKMNIALLPLARENTVFINGKKIVMQEKKKHQKNFEIALSKRFDITNLGLKHIQKDKLKLGMDELIELVHDRGEDTIQNDIAKFADAMLAVIVDRSAPGVVPKEFGAEANFKLIYMNAGVTIRENIYGQNLNQLEEVEHLEELARKFTKHFPLVKGRVKKNPLGPAFVVNRGEWHGMRKYMQLYLLPKCENPAFPCQPLGEAWVKAVDNEESNAKLLAAKTLSKPAYRFEVK